MSLRDQLVRNIDEVELQRRQREPLYDTRCGGVIGPRATWARATTSSRPASGRARITRTTPRRTGDKRGLVAGGRLHRADSDLDYRDAEP